MVLDFIEGGLYNEVIIRWLVGIVCTVEKGWEDHLLCDLGARHWCIGRGRDDWPHETQVQKTIR